MKINKIGNRVPEIISQTGIVFIGVSLYSVCNLFYHFIMVRMLSPIDYGHLNTLLAIFMIISMPTHSLQIVTTRYVSLFLAHQQFKKIGAFLQHLLIVMASVSCSIFLITLFANPFISSFLKLESWSLVTLLGICLFFGLIIPIPWGGLQGLLKFESLCINLTLNGGLKVLFGFLLVRIGWGVEGAMSGIGLAYFTTTVLSLLMLWKGITRNTGAKCQEKSTLQTDPLSWKEVSTYFFSAGLSFFCFLILTNVDLILVKNIFTPPEAGYYSIAQMAGKIILFLPLPIVMVLFPKFAYGEALGNTTLPLLNQGLIIGGLLCGGVFLLFQLFPLEVIWILTGKRPLECVPLIRLFSLNMTIFSLLLILLYYHLSKKGKTFLYTLMVFTPIQTCLIVLFHKTLIQVLLMVSIVAISLLAVNLGLIYIRGDFHRRKGKQFR